MFDKIVKHMHKYVAKNVLQGLYYLGWRMLLFQMMLCHLPSFFRFRIYTPGYNYLPVHTEIYGMYRPRSGRQY